MTSPIGRLVSELPSDGASGAGIHAFMEGIFPLCRSLTGRGVRVTLAAIGERVPIRITDVPSGAPILDWTAPDEWTIGEAWIEGVSGRRWVDLAESSLHVVSYSGPVDGVFTFEELRDRLFTLPDRPTLIPYRTSYWSPTWGFCLTHERLQEMASDGPFRVRIDARLEPGHLTYGEVVIPGERDEEILLSTHICHPSLANDNLSGIGVLTAVAERLATTTPRFTHRLLFSPGTVGPISWLAGNPEAVGRVRHGLVVVSAGDPGPLTYKRSRGGDALVDRIAETVLADHAGATVRAFEPWGCDERQFSSPGYRLPVGCLMRTPPGEFPENHTSADDMAFVTPEALGESARACLEILAVIDGDRTMVNRSPFGEPQLGRRGLYRSAGGAGSKDSDLPDERALLWVLNMTDGENTLLDIARRSGMPFPTILAAAEALEGADLLREGSAG